VPNRLSTPPTRARHAAASQSRAPPPPAAFAEMELYSRRAGAAGAHVRRHASQTEPAPAQSGRKVAGSRGGAVEKEG
jgi:hypothetical protein